MIEWIRHLENSFLHKNLETVFEGISSSRKKALNNWFQDQWRKINALTRSLLSASEDSELFNEKAKELLDESVAQYNEFLEAFLLDEQGKMMEKQRKVIEDVRVHISDMAESSQHAVELDIFCCLDIILFKELVNDIWTSSNESYSHFVQAIITYDCVPHDILFDHVSIVQLYMDMD